MKQLGSAYAIIFYIQNIGLSLVPMLIGWLIDDFATKTDAAGKIIGYDYTLPMSCFALFGVIAVCLACLLKYEDKRMNYGLENANIR
jgi:phosphotransferase system  glucose/maltose/N-acetylglucosamine-specific IIC component